MIALLVIVGGAIGAPLRYFTDRFTGTQHDSVFPWGTLTVNVAGSLVLGIVAGSNSSPAVTALVGTGFCGALTTYSTFSYETYKLVQERSLLLAVLNLVISVLAGVGAAGLGISIGRII